MREDKWMFANNNSTPRPIRLKDPPRDPYTYPVKPESVTLEVLEEGFGMGAVANAIMNSLSLVGLITLVLLAVVKCNPDDRDAPPPPACLAKEAKQ